MNVTDPTVPHINKRIAAGQLFVRLLSLNTARPWHSARRLALASEALIPWIHSQSQLSGSRTSTPSRILDSAPSAGPWPNRHSAYQLRSASSQQPENPAPARAKSCNRTMKSDDIRNVYHFSPQSISIFVCFPPLALRPFPSYWPPLSITLLFSPFLVSAAVELSLLGVPVPLFPHPGFAPRPQQRGSLSELSEFVQEAASAVAGVRESGSDHRLPARPLLTIF